MMVPDPYAVLALHLPSEQKLVLLDLALHLHADGAPPPSVARLAADTGLPDDTVRLALTALADAGHIQVDPR